MKQTLLATFFALFTLAAAAQSSPDGSSESPASPPATFSAKQPKVSVYPNPATDFISVNRDENVKQVVVFNLVGRKLKSFEDITKDERYDVSDLPDGMYLVQVLDFSNKIITTQRITKR